MANSKKLTVEDLTSWYLQGTRPHTRLVTGIEVEQPLVFSESGKAVPFYSEGKRNIDTLIKLLVKRCGWKLEKRDAGYPIRLSRGETLLTLEVWGGLEIVGKPHRNLHDLTAEYEVVACELGTVGRLLGITFAGLGIQPVSTTDQTYHVDRPRWLLMIDHFKKAGSTTFTDWNRRSAAIQVNIDSTGRKNLETKFYLLNRISPIIAAMFGNSIVQHGKLTSYASNRYHYMQTAEEARFNPPPSFISPDFKLEDHTEHALDIPMIFIERRGKSIPIKNRTFRQYMEKGYKGHTARIADWEKHLGFVWQDVRIKHWIEFRPVDTVPPALAPAVAAVIKGLVYDQHGWDCMAELTAGWSYDEWRRFRSDVAKHGLAAEIRGVTAGTLAKHVLRSAHTNLTRLNHKNALGEYESIYLEPIEKLIHKGHSPASFVAEKWLAGWRMPDLLKWSSY